MVALFSKNMGKQNATKCCTALHSVRKTSKTCERRKSQNVRGLTLTYTKQLIVSRLMQRFASPLHITNVFTITFKYCMYSTLICKHSRNKIFRTFSDAFILKYY